MRARVRDPVNGMLVRLATYQVLPAAQLQQLPIAKLERGKTSSWLILQLTRRYQVIHILAVELMVKSGTTIALLYTRETSSLRIAGTQWGQS